MIVTEGRQDIISCLRKPDNLSTFSYSIMVHRDKAVALSPFDIFYFRLKLMKRVILLLILVLVVVGFGYVYYQKNEDDGFASERMLPAKDPRLTFDTPFRNVKPEVKYVGDAACAECHSAIDESYHRHPMECRLTGLKIVLSNKSIPLVPLWPLRNSNAIQG